MGTISSNLVIRVLEYRDIPAVMKLEEAVWKPKGIETVPEPTLERWIAEGIFLGCFAGEQLVGYAYCEEISFGPIPPYSEELLAALESYKDSYCAPEGDALHGVSIAAILPGVGSLLFGEMVKEARERGLRYFVSLARLSGLGRFVEENRPVLGEHPLEVLAVLYAIQAVAWVEPALVGSPLSLLSLPEGFPRIKRKDAVVSRFASLGKELWAVAKTSFDDPESLGYSALLVLHL
jgi:hypothetical protein